MFTVFRFRRLALPLLVVLILAGWSGYWVYAQDRAESEIGRHAAELQARGGSFTCEGSQWSGFPLRLEMRCAGARLDVPGGTVVETGAIEVVGHLYDPARVVAQTDRITAEGPPNWSFGGQNIDFVGTVVTTERIEFRASGDKLTFADGRMPAVALDALEVAGTLENMPRGRPSDVGDFLKEAARQGSRVTIDEFEATMAEIEVTASGSVAFGPEGPTGTLSTTVSNYDEVLAELGRRGVISKQAALGSSMVIGFLQGREKSDGEVTVDLRFHEGQVFWGPFVVAEIPPLE